MSKISAIVSAYYAEEYLSDRIENLLLQDVFPHELEVIIVCRVNSPEYNIAVHPFNDPRLIVIQDGGFGDDPIPTVYEAWNIGIGYATGDYLTNANSDDRHYPGALRAMADALDLNLSYDVVYTDIDRAYDLNGPVQGKFEWMEGGLLELYWKGCFLGPMPMWRRSLHGAFGLFDGSLTSAGDYEFWMRLASHDIRFFHIRHSHGLHLERPNALEHRSPVRSTWEVARVKSLYRSTIEVR